LLNTEIELHWKVLDIWTWGWFPWIPLAITNPDVEFTLLDSTRKKIDSVNWFIEELWIKNAVWIWGRAEELSAKADYKKKFDFVVSRATAYLPQIISWSLPFLKKWGIMIFYKLRNEDEIADWVELAKKCRLSSFEIKEYIMLDQKRIFMFIW
jgi:16S rRNA (guanine527-N7)-methyltransferase